MKIDVAPNCPNWVLVEVKVALAKNDNDLLKTIDTLSSKEYTTDKESTIYSLHLKLFEAYQLIVTGDENELLVSFSETDEQLLKVTIN